MKTLNLIIALLLCTQAYGQVMDLDTLLEIDSKNAYLKTVIENGYSQAANQREGFLVYELEYSAGKIGSYYSLLTTDVEWGFLYPVYTMAFNIIVAAIKERCRFETIYKFTEKQTFSCYSCPKAKASGYIGFTNDQAPSILYFSRSHIENLEDN